MSGVGHVAERSPGSWVSVSVFWLVQVSALLVFFVPFRWPLVGLWAVSHFVRAIGLTLTFHRYFAHRAFKMNRFTQFVWALIGTAAMQKGPLWWAGHHVNHHKYADRDGDPHSPHVSGFYYAHIGWFTQRRPATTRSSRPTRWSATSARCPELRILNEHYLAPPAALALGMYLYGGMQWLAWGFCCRR